jgi:hypothetical protein
MTLESFFSPDFFDSDAGLVVMSLGLFIGLLLIGLVLRRGGVEDLNDSFDRAESQLARNNTDGSNQH